LDFLKEASADNSARTCVFCGQELGAKAEFLVSLYFAFFKGGYEQLQKEIISATDYFKGLNIEAILEKISGDLKAKDLDVALNDSKILELVELKKEFEKELDKKRDLNYSGNFDSFDRLKSGIEQICKDLKELEQNKLNISSTKSIVEL
jgi:hypothetical protein